MLNAAVDKMGICNEYVQKARNYNITTKAKALKRLSAAYAKRLTYVLFMVDFIFYYLKTSIQLLQ